MTRLHILITSTYYWPEIAGNAPYVTGVAEGLAERGHAVTVATGFPHYPMWRRQGERVPARNGERHGVRIRRRWHYIPQTHSAAHRALYEGSLFAGGLTALGLRRPDVTVGVTPTLAGAALAAMAGALHRRPFVLVFQDLMGRAAAQSGFAGGAGVAGAVGRAELAIARRAAAIGIITPGFREYLEAGGVRPGRIHRVRNWFSGHAPAAGREETRGRLGWGEDEAICLHAGNMGHKQGLSNLVVAGALLAGTKVRIVLAGDGNDRARLEQEAAFTGSSVTFLGPQEPGAYEAMLAAADVLLVNQLPAVSDMALPSKLTSYFAAGRPVVAAAAAGSEAAKEVRLASAGVVVEPGQPAALAAALQQLLSERARADTLGEAGKAYAARTLTREAALDEYEAMIVAAARSGKR
ncbi:MAG: glycosyltransferase family 4 protein [Chloroflexi bacterium]|nr:glycosyltransferase family 4 protein [Chloroflexota bacterium]